MLKAAKIPQQHIYKHINNMKISELREELKQI